MKVLRNLLKNLNLEGIKRQAGTSLGEIKTKLGERLNDVRKKGKYAVGGMGIGAGSAGYLASKAMQKLSRAAGKYGKKQYQKGLATGLATGAGVTGAGVLGVNAYKKHKDKDKD